MSDPRFQDAQTELTNRFTDLMNLRDCLVERAKRYHQYGTSVRLTIIILGAVSAAQTTVKDQMGADSKSIMLLFSILAILMAIGAGLESFFKWSHRSGTFHSLAAMCDAFQYTAHDKWHKVASKYTAQPNEGNLDRALELAAHYLEAMNTKIITIQNRAANLGVTDLALECSSFRSSGHVQSPARTQHNWVIERREWSASGRASCR